MSTTLACREIKAVPRAVFVPVDAITKPTDRIDRIELEDTLPAVAPATRPPPASRRKLAQLAVAVAGIAGATLIAMAATSRAATSAHRSASSSADSPGTQYAALAVLRATPAQSSSLDFAIAEHRLVLGSMLADANDLEGAVAQLTSALVLLDELAVRDAASRTVALARARTDEALAAIATKRGQSARASIYLRAAAELRATVARR